MLCLPVRTWLKKIHLSYHLSQYDGTASVYVESINVNGQRNISTAVYNSAWAFNSVVLDFIYYSE